MIPFAGAGVVILFAAVIAAVIAALFLPELLEHWDERLFHLASNRNLTADISYLPRKAELDAYVEILSRESLHFINGKGVGASYYWHPAYKPEIFLVYDPGPDTDYDLWFTGHSTWTYSMFSGGIIALLAKIALFIGIIVASLKAADASHPGHDQWPAHLPFISTIALKSETITAFSQSSGDRRPDSFGCSCREGSQRHRFSRFDHVACRCRSLDPPRRSFRSHHQVFLPP